MPSATDDESETPFPTLNLSAAAFSSHLSPEDAYTAPIASPPRGHGFGAGDSVDEPNRPRMRRIHSGLSTGGVGGGRRRRRPWRKLMWVNQSYPDNYTDQNTFLENLQRNPRLKPYDFWPLVADSTVILQHVCSVIIFIVCFSSIFQERVSPVSVVSWSSFGTFLGWLLWERWVAEEEERVNGVAQDPRSGGGGGGAGGSGAVASAAATLLSAGGGGGGPNTLSRRRTRAASIRRPLPPPPPSLLNVGRQAIVVSSPDDAGPHDSGRLSTVPSSVASTAPPSADTSAASSTTNLLARPPLLSPPSLTPPTVPPNPTPTGAASSTSTPSLAMRANASQEALLADIDIINDEDRTHMRLGTIKSAILIYSTLLGLSPILKSLTLSTSNDSIWAMSFWLLTINVFFFDYSGGVGAKFPASLSTNAALMASTVLASRLPSTEQVFSLTLFSIEVFGLFPVFRRHVRHRSWRYHLALAVALVLGAGFGVGMVIKPPDYVGWPWSWGVIGMVVSVIISVVATGGCSWWLIGLQKYKNEIRGPWDQARPVIMSRPRWD